MAELKKEIEKLEKLLGIYKRRILQLENFIRKHGLQVPGNEEDIDELEQDISVDVHTNDKAIVIVENEEEDATATASLVNRDLEVKQNKINELTEKYMDIENKFKKLEEEKLNITSKLDQATDEINEFKNNKKEKTYSEENEKLRAKFDDIIQKQREKIERLEKQLELAQQNTGKKEQINVTLNKQNIQINNSIEFFNQLFRLSEKNGELGNFLKGFSKALPSDSEQKVISIEDLPEDKDEDSQQNLQDFQLEKQKFKNEKKYIMKTLEEKAEKIAQLEVENKELYDKGKLFESKLSSVCKIIM